MSNRLFCVGRRFSVAALALSCGSAHAQNELRVVARQAIATPDNPSALGFTGSFSNLAISPAGRLAFTAESRSLQPSGAFAVLSGAHVAGADGPALITGGLLYDLQNPELRVYGIDDAGNVLLRGRSASSTPVDTLSIHRASDVPIRVVSVGDPVPSIFGSTVSVIPSEPLSSSPPLVRILPPSGQYPIPVRLAASTPVFGAILGSSQTSLQLLATTAPLATPNQPPTLPSAWPADLALSGSFLTDRLGHADLTPRVYHNGVVSPLLLPNALVPGGLPNERVQTFLNARIASNGHVIAAYSTTNQSVVVLMGPPDDLQIVFRSGTIISSPSLAIRANTLASARVPGLSIDDGGFGYILTETVQLVNPASSQSRYAILRVARGQQPRVAFLSGEPVRTRTGELVSPSVSSDPAVQTSGGGGRFVWRVLLPFGRDALCSFTDDGDPYIIFADGDTAGSPPVTVSVLLRSAPNIFADTRLAINARGDAAVALTLAPRAVIYAPAPVFTCGDIDINNDGIWPSDEDIIDFFNVFSGAPCPTLRCDTIDFNRNGVYPEEQDVIDFLNVLAGGSCA